MSNSFFEMSIAFSIGFVIFFGPALILVASLKKDTQSKYQQLIPLVLLYLIAFFLASGFIARFFGPSVGALIVCILIAALLCALAARSLKNECDVQLEKRDSHISFWISIILSTLAIASCAWIYCSLSWGYDGKAVNIVSPMQLDPQRNTNIVASILRGDLGVFLPNDPMLYQLLWYRGAALLMTILPSTVTPYFQVGGLTLLMGWALYFVLLSLILRRRQHYVPNLMLIIVLSTLLIVDARVDDLLPFKRVVDLIYGGVEHPPINLEYFSLKLLALTAPQHCLFFIFFIGAIYFRDFDSRIIFWRIPFWALLAISAIVTSPVLAAFAFVPYGFADLLVSSLSSVRFAVRRSLNIAYVAVAAFFIHWIVIGFPPSDLFLRKGAISLTTFWSDAFNFQDRIIPFIPFWIFGFTLGAYIVALLLRRIMPLSDSDRKLYASLNILLVTLISTFILWNIVLTDFETRRHSSMVLVVLISLICGMLSISIFTRLKSQLGKIFVFAIFIVGVALEFNFIASYTIYQPNLLAKDIPWNDYFLANKFLSQNQRHRGVIAASGEGLVLPISNTAAVTLAPTLAMIVHQRALGAGGELIGLIRIPNDKGALKSSEIDGQWLGVARRAGFDTVIWGPVEEMLWGSFGRRILTDSAMLIASFGEVGIFEYPKGIVINTDNRAELIRKSFFAKVACNAYIRKQLRKLQSNTIPPSERHALDQGMINSPNAENLIKLISSDFDRQSICNLESLLKPLAIESSGVAHERELQLNNLAKARQSSIRSNRIDIFAPNHAFEIPSPRNDGNREKIVFTENESEPWWEVDLGRNYDIAAVQIDWATYPLARMDANLYLLISSKPFPEKVPADPYKLEENVFLVSRDLIKKGSPISTQSVRGRFIRIQVDGDGYLALERVRIWESVPTSK